ncbi:hypothetical protein A2Z67_03820 [Candidatus Woesebacteria bacterium RBG_13_36_22]|uniref:HTH cro/C1-type domain-containing protein n=1 Tax=Candidatus Woesebacteria bacterium RBG_13_36_22 TaxID=1802478 RepID=A0A1F7X2I7_9BACT|nr:MAG: hypothetical protein A2Z67_03820 [Candidatus Woesebacteria bacterium RBG_13_36_22]
MSVGEKIKQLRIAKGWTQRDLSIASDVTVESISRFENGHIENPHKSIIRSIAQALSTTVETLKGDI